MGSVIQRKAGLFIAVILVAISFAFASNKTIVMCGKVGMYYYPVDPTLRGVWTPGGWDCIGASGTNHCLYIVKPGVISSPPYNETEVEPDAGPDGQLFMFFQ